MEVLRDLAGGGKSVRPLRLEPLRLLLKHGKGKAEGTAAYFRKPSFLMT